jgi:hypothetical protein
MAAVRLTAQPPSGRKECYVCPRHEAKAAVRREDATTAKGCLPNGTFGGSAAGRQPAIVGDMKRLAVCSHEVELPA